jgi:signal transduction histidine kinase
MFERTVAVWKFTPQAWLPLAGFVLTLGLGLYVWHRKRTALLNQSFALLNVAAALWNLDVFLLFTIQDAAVAGALDRLLQVPIVSIPFLALFFFFTFLGLRRNHPLLIGFGLWTVMLWFVSSSPEFISSWERHWYGYYGRAGRLYPLFIGTLLIYLAVSCRFLLRAHKSSRDHLFRNQIVYLLLANLVLVVVSLHNFGPLYGAARIPLGNLAAVLYFFVISSTIVRYRLLDAHVLFRYGLIYSTLTIVLSGLYLLIILGLQGWCQEEVFSGSLLLPMMPAVAVAFAFGPAKSSLQERLDRHFFRSRALLRSRLAEFADSIGPFDREGEIWRAAWDSGWKYVDPEWAAVVSDRDDGLRPEITAGHIPDNSDEKGIHLPLDGREGALGACLLGPKRGGDLYSGEELAFVRAIAAQSALAIEKVRLVAEGRKKERLATVGGTAAAISHELRNYLNTIRAAAALLRSRVPKGEAEELVGVVEGEIRRGDRYISDVLSACREPLPSRCPVEFVAFLERFSRSWPQGDFAAMKIELDLPPSPLVICVDPLQLERVLRNLGRNSAEVTGGSGTVRIRCERLEGGKVMLAFSDDGPGIAESALPRLFEPFHTTKKSGTGLGLSIAKAIVDAHGGKIEVRSGTGPGASFRITLPSDEPERGSESGGRQKWSTLRGKESNHG